MIYLDNAATSFKKPESVYKKFMSVWREMGANAGRGGHRLALRAAEQIYLAREKLAELFNIENPENIAFTQNTTTALNMAVKGVVKKGDHIIITTLEHNSVLRPVVSTGCSYSIVGADENGQILPEAVEAKIRENTRLIIVNHASNVTKSVCDIEKIGQIAKRRGVIFLVDAAQSAGVLDIDAVKMNIDMLAFAGHKSLFGPLGTGGLYVREGLKINTIMEGGSGGDSLSFNHPDHMPDLLTYGTANAPAIAALGAGIDFIKAQGIKNIFMHENMLLSRFEEKIKNIKGVRLYTPSLSGVNVCSINLEGRDCVEVSEILDRRFNIATRAGFHCSPLCHAMLSTIDTGGTLRFSFGFFNTKNQVDKAALAIDKIVKNRI